MLLGAFLFFNYSCGEDDDDDDLCEAFDAVPASCEIPTICCPTDGGNCYYVNPDGNDYYCNSANATDNDPDGCDAAMNQYIDEQCTKMTPAKSAAVKIDLSNFTRKLMERARLESVCM